jgi:uncharacterized protein YvpB
MADKLVDAAANFAKEQHQIEAWEWLQGTLSPATLELFFTKYRTKNDQKPIVAGKLNPLPVQYMSQRDNYRDASRTCFSSSCAMLLKFLKPNSIKTDDDYIKVVFNYGDTTNGAVQVAALKSFGLSTYFETRGNRELVKKQIDAGKPVPAGFLHHGTPGQPTGGGHWLCIIGYDDTGYWVNDPWGEAELLFGTYSNTDGAKKHYSYMNFEPRWMADGPRTGWCIIA